MDELTSRERADFYYGHPGFASREDEEAAEWEDLPDHDAPVQARPDDQRDG